MIVVNLDKAKNYGLVALVVLNFIFAGWMMHKFSKLEKTVIASAQENRSTTLQQKVSNYNTATANAYTIILPTDVFKNHVWEIDEIRNGTEMNCMDGKQHWFSKKNCFMRIKPSIIDSYKTTSPFGFQVTTVQDTVYVSYWKKLNAK